MTSQGESGLVERVCFAILDRPVCVWGVRAAEVNARFLDSVDPGFFMHEAEVHGKALREATEDRERQTHAMALRLSYGMALETLFAFLAASAQAPHCMFAWLSLYRNDELRDLVRRIIAGEDVLAFEPYRPLTWRGLASEMLRPLEGEDQEKYNWAVGRFTEAWELFAADFLNESRSKEYNSIKHGIRSQPGSFSVRAEAEGQTLLESESVFGHRLVFAQPKANRRMQYDVVSVFMTLEPQKCIAALSLISVSIHNLLVNAFARSGHAKRPLQLIYPDTDHRFDMLKEETAPIRSFTYSSRFELHDPTAYPSREEILAVYEDPSR